MTRTVAITGAQGFVGTHLLEAAAASGGAWRAFPAPEELDVCVADAVRDWIAATRPDAVVHLAAQSNVVDAFREPRRTFEVNVFGTLGLLEAIRAKAPRARLLFVSSGDVYGLIPETALPVSEDRPFEPRNPYAVSKVAAELACRQWHFTEGMDVVIARPFNHIGPGQDDRFVVASLARQVAEIAAGHREPVVDAGDLDVTRDFTDVRDVVRAYLLLLERGRTGAIYNVGSGQEVRVRDLLGRLATLGGIDPRIHQDPQRMRRAEQRRVAASFALLEADTGWRPTIGLDRSLADIIEYWNSRIGT